MFNSPMIRCLPILACIPHLLLTPLSGNAVLLHDHDNHGLHVHVPLETDVLCRTNGATFLRETHPHSDANLAKPRHDESTLDESTSLLYFVVPVDIASPRRCDLIIKAVQIQVYVGIINGIAPAPVWHPPDARACSPANRAGDSLAMILRSSNALLI